MTGSDWRYVVAYWPAMVAGLFQRRDEASAAPCAATLRQSRYGAAKRKKNKNKGSKRGRSPSPVGAEAIAALVAGSSDCSAGEDEDLHVQPPVTSSRAYNDAYKGAPVSDAVLELVCRAAALSGRLNGDNRLPSQSITEQAATDLAKEAYEFVTLYVAALLGSIHDSKEHRLAYHLYAALTNHGNLVDGDTSANELLHKTCKRMYQRTSKKHDDYTMQMLRAEQTLTCCINEALVEQVGHRVEQDNAGLLEDDNLPDWTGGALHLPDEGDEDSGIDDDECSGIVIGQAYADAAELAAGQVDPASKTLRRTKGRRARVADLVTAAKGNIFTGLASTLGVSEDESLVVCNSIVFSPTFEWGATLDRQRVHAADSNYGAAWYDHIRYKDPSAPSEVHHGLVRLVVVGIGNKSSRSLVVQRMEAAVCHEHCVRTRFGFRRLKWKMDNDAAVPQLAVVNLADVLRLEQVEPDFVPFTERHGLFVKPTMPETEVEWHERRFFTNPFHPWTSAPVAGH